MGAVRTHPDERCPSPSRATRIFISYSRDDSARVRELQRAASCSSALELYSFPYEDAQGNDWQETFRNLIGQADGLVCLVGATTSENANIAWELDESARRGIPILLVGRRARTLARRLGEGRVSTLETSSPDGIVAMLRELV